MSSDGVSKDSPFCKAKLLVLEERMAPDCSRETNDGMLAEPVAEVAGLRDLLRTVVEVPSFSEEAQ